MPEYESRTLHALRPRGSYGVRDPWNTYNPGAYAPTDTLVWAAPVNTAPSRQLQHVLRIAAHNQALSYIDKCGAMNHDRRAFPRDFVFRTKDDVLRKKDRTIGSLLLGFSGQV